MKRLFGAKSQKRPCNANILNKSPQNSCFFEIWSEHFSQDDFRRFNVYLHSYEGDCGCSTLLSLSETSGKGDRARRGSDVSNLKLRGRFAYPPPVNATTRPSTHYSQFSVRPPRMSPVFQAISSAYRLMRRTRAPRPQQEATEPCPFYHELYKPSGLPRHRTACEVKIKAQKPINNNLCGAGLGMCACFSALSPACSWLRLVLMVLKQPQCLVVLVQRGRGLPVVASPARRE